MRAAKEERRMNWMARKFVIEGIKRAQEHCSS
jgi:hypothetical protein